MENQFNQQATNLQVFNSSRFGDVRTTMSESGGPLFCLADVARALGVSNNRNLNGRLDQGGVHTVDTPTFNQFGAEVVQEMTFINEPNLYRCIFQSRKEEAKQFQDWVFNEVLPELRKTGAYVATNADESEADLINRALIAATAALERSKQKAAIESARADVAEQRAEIAEENARANKESADYTNEVLLSTDTYTLTQISKDLGMRSVHEFTRWAKEIGIIYKQSGTWMPTSKVAGRGVFGTRTAKFFHNDGSVGTSMSLVVTEYGRKCMHDRIRRDQEKRNTNK